MNANAMRKPVGAISALGAVVLAVLSWLFFGFGHPNFPKMFLLQCVLLTALAAVLVYRYRMRS